MFLNGQDAIIKLNVGGTHFTTSRNTLTWIPDTFFTSLLSGRIPTLKDDSGAIFIDRDPKLFHIILNYMRSKQVDLREVEVVALRHEAQFYGIGPLGTFSAKHSLRHTCIYRWLAIVRPTSGNWLEIAYGTSAGTVRIIAQHPETAGQPPKLFQTFTVHRSRVSRIALTTAYLISGWNKLCSLSFLAKRSENFVTVCTEYNHVRSWKLSRFRGMINTQPSSTPLASFKVMTLESADADGDNVLDVGPFGDKDSEQVFVQKVVPDTCQLYIRLASTGER
ncbi:BTB [Trichuris trichiura]|uniref:BTB n=1 Tax=Trichuris trichiura TaxID=36087 RepID=A0A077Z9Q7_TRITR|nr:BTB [Trichuris trichiura]